MRRAGTSIGQFRIDRRLGHGGMGSVYAATDEMTGREVAIKLLRPELVDQDGFVDRFKAEARTLARLDHPRIARLHGFFRHDDDFFMVMEFVRGMTLSAIIRDSGRIAPRTAVIWTCDILQALQYAHGLGVVHRDVKPANIIIEEDTGRARLTDFGIAHSDGDHRLTQTGQTVGTIAYMAPEQLTTTETTGHADLYAMAVVLFEMLTGSIPYAATTTFTLMREVSEGVPPAALETVPPEASALVPALTRALARRPEDRYPDANALRAALEHALGLDSPVTPTLPSLPSPDTSAHARRSDAQRASQAVTRVEAVDVETGPVEATDDDTTPPADRRSLVPALAAVAVLGLLVVLAVIYARSGRSDTPASAAPVVAQTVPPVAPVVPAGPTVPTGGAPAMPGAGPEAPDTAAARRANPPAVTSTDAPARKAETAPLPPAEFPRVLLMVPSADDEGDVDEVDVLLRFEGRRLVIANAETRVPVRTLTYTTIGEVTYSAAPSRLRAFGRGPAHWLDLTVGREHVVLRLDKRNYEAIIDALEARSRAVVTRAERKR